MTWRVDFACAVTLKRNSEEIPSLFCKVVIYIIKLTCYSLWVWPLELLYTSWVCLATTEGNWLYSTDEGSNLPGKPWPEKKEKQFSIFLKYNLFLRGRAPYVDQKKPHLSGWEWFKFIFSLRQNLPYHILQRISRQLIFYFCLPLAAKKTKLLELCTQSKHFTEFSLPKTCKY